MMARGDDQTLVTLQSGIPPTGVRFPDGLRDRIKAAAAANNRSMNSEIVSRLEASFRLDATALSSEIAALISQHVETEVRRRLQQIATQIGGA